MRQLFGYNLNEDTEGTSGLGHAAPARQRQLRVMPSFVRVQRDQQARESQRAIPADLRNDGSRDRKLDGLQR